MNLCQEKLPIKLNENEIWIEHYGLSIENIHFFSN